jgi:pimeloyl-ACP methyl ester carboxylesterase
LVRAEYRTVDAPVLGTTTRPAAFPKEISTPPRRLIDRVFRIERYTAMPRGGHFAALEQPALLADDIATFFRPMR